ncbi:MAG TPA: deoxyribodipyrimidine photo-lyase [Isosphaeraceae bacterium]|nr:deoxyribodipyrimidine photo-lyase [Isosphaeraceae bacterium]
MATLEALWRPYPRVRIGREGAPINDGRCIVYWMQRAQRGQDNAALNLAIALGNVLKKPVLAVFGLTADYLGAQRRHYRFLVDALPEIHLDLQARGVEFVVRLGSPEEVVRQVVETVRPAALIGDENPLRAPSEWRARVVESVQVPVRFVDADVVVPSSLFPRQEYAARTLRPKIHRVLEEYLKPIPNVKAQVAWPGREKPEGEPLEPEELLSRLGVQGVAEVSEYRGGPKEAHRRLKRFLKERLPNYATERNEPTPYQTSELSAHLHFGHISPLSIALAVRDADAPQESINAYLEELIVRRELAINFVARNDRYDELSGCPEWALKTLAKHSEDRRPVIYSAKQLEAGETGDPLWNAAQKEMVLTGRMHNYLRMYWAKKILHWTPDAETAFSIALDLNDRYEMDGRDPNGYTGVAWAIGGVHDRPWPERPIFGTVRYMSYDSTRRKFDSAAYIRRVEEIERGRA